MVSTKQEPWEWLMEWLTKYGKTETCVVMAAAKAQGYTKADLRLACLTCNVKKTSTKAPRRFFWELWGAAQ